MPGVWKRWNGTEWVPQGGLSVGPGGMSEAEFAHWQVRAALLDPLAYTVLTGSGASTTVDADETWYIVSAWKLDAGTPTYYHRVPDAASGQVYAIQEGESITCEAVAGAFAYICKPADVIATDTRYTEDPKALYYERLHRTEAELTNHVIGHNNTGSSEVQTAFPTDFAYGMTLHVSSHDVAWSILRHSGGSAGINLNNEVSDTNRIRFAERVVLPFTRATFPNFASRGVSQAEGSAAMRYVKLPGDW